MASAEWTGVIELGCQELDCRLFSASGRAKPFPLRMIHLKCKTPLKPFQKPEREKIEEREETPEEKVEETKPVEVRAQIYCPTCNIALKADEIGRAAETDAGLILLTDVELESLEFKKEKRVKAEFIDINDLSITAIGAGRRLYVFPKPAAVQVYFNVFHILQESNTAGFIPELVIKKAAYPAMLRPLSFPEPVFGALRQVLIVDVLRDSDTLKDPGDFPDFPQQIQPLDVSQLAQQIADAQSAKRPLEPERCVNPKRQRFKDLLKRKMKEALK